MSVVFNEILNSYYKISHLRRVFLCMITYIWNTVLDIKFYQSAPITHYYGSLLYGMFVFKVCNNLFYKHTNFVKNGEKLKIILVQVILVKPVTYNVVMYTI